MVVGVGGWTAQLIINGSSTAQHTAAEQFSVDLLCNMV